MKPSPLTTLIVVSLFRTWTQKKFMFSKVRSERKAEVARDHQWTRKGVIRLKNNNQSRGD